MSEFNEKLIADLVEIIAKAADQEILPRFRRLEKEAIREKSRAYDLVTDADIGAEKVITAEISKLLPHATIIGEEAVSENSSLLAALDSDELLVTIDPVDGTFNFASGVPLFGSMVTIVKNGETIAAVIYDPMNKDCIWGLKGEGSYYRAEEGANSRLKVAAPAELNQMIGGISWQYMEEPLRSTLARNHAKCYSHFGYRCAAHEYRLLASGHAHFSIYNKLMPWDHLGGVLIHSEAGGFSARFDGSAYQPTHLDGGLLVAPDQASWELIRQELWA